MKKSTRSEQSTEAFTFSVSRSAASIDDKLHDVAASMIRELEESLADFRLNSFEIIDVDGIPAAELFYEFKSDNTPVHQKQTVLLLDDPVMGKKKVCYIGTCVGDYSESDIEQYRKMIRGIRFQHGK
ncbi:DcrB-related protein [Mangrovibacter yixingensis]|uniref:DcrB-related protein n=1 Tax=Mangrovibacter yixingensis TaxID=1529639 RepID=UPI001CFED12F|nr:DcrB-related protein [Mangrovibacter yixingensis]